MTNEEIRIKIAEACGWVKQPVWVNCLGGDVHEWRKDGCLTERCVGGHSLQELPDYLNDLNACAEFEKTLRGNKLDWYEHNLGRVVFKDTTDDDWSDSLGSSANTKPLHASARQRAIAFLKTLNLYPESPNVETKE